MPKKEKAKIPAMTLEQLTENLFVLKQMMDTLNIAIAGIAYAKQVKGDALDKTTPEEYFEWIQKELHPLVRRTNDLHKEIAKIVAKDAKKAVKPKKEKK